MDLKIVRFVHLNEYLTCVFMFKWKNALLPSIFDDYFVYNSLVHSYDTRMCNALHVPMVKSNLGKKSVSFKGILTFTCVFMFKWKNALLPSIFDDYFVYNSLVHSYDTRMCNALHVPMVKSNLGKKSVSFKGILAFNELLKQQFDFNCSLPTIKYKIKTALLIKNYV